VAEVIERLLKSEQMGKKVTVNDIGVVAPFYRQVRMIRNILRERGLRDIRVGSVEDYQGQEERILIVSCVRASERWIQDDKEHQLGLLFNDRTFNVCITRAKCLLLCIGNPHVLSVDRNWKTLLSRCVKNNTYQGIEYTPEDKVEAAGYVPADYAALGPANYSQDIPWNIGL
jgi:helicase MOV-10